MAREFEAKNENSEPTLLQKLGLDKKRVDELIEWSAARNARLAAR